MLTLVIPATGRYAVLARQLVYGLRRTCADNDNLRIVTVTDAHDVAAGSDRLPWIHRPWPAPTYAKYDMVMALASGLAPGEVFLMDADTSAAAGDENFHLVSDP